jgi:hypothetical protein
MASPIRCTHPTPPPADLLIPLQQALVQRPDAAAFTVAQLIEVAGHGRFTGRDVKPWLAWLRSRPDPQAVEEWDLPDAA